MEEAPENGKESSHSAHATGMNEFKFVRPVLQTITSATKADHSPPSGAKVENEWSHTPVSVWLGGIYWDSSVSFIKL